MPASDAAIETALRELKCFSLLRGFRGNPAADIETVVGSIRALIEFAAKRHEGLLEMDVNPLMITPDRCIAADVMIREAVQ